jgi:2,3-diketo-5-methylthio-1-phosphopentane phosphatase
MGEFVVCDLDGTITIRDVSVLLLDRFAAGRYQYMEEMYHSGEWSLKRTSLEEFRLLKQPRETMTAFVREKAEFDPDFQRFAELCRTKGVGIAVASEGLDFYVETLLDVMGLRNLVYYANLAAFGERVLEDVFFPHWNPDCGECGTCKAEIIRKYRDWGNEVTFIGDGRTDRHAVHFADRIYAKGLLLEYCRENRIDCEEYEGFKDIIQKMGLEAGEDGDVPVRDPV